jgi:hypothetical protein
VVLARSQGLFHFPLLIAAIPVIVFAIVGILRPARRSGRNVGDMVALGAMLLTVQIFLLGFTTHYYYYHPRTFAGSALPMGAVMVGGMLAMLGGAWGKRWLIVAFAAHVAATSWVVAHSYEPKIDVWLFHQDSAAALLRGENPFAITFKNVYGHKNRFYSDEIQVAGRVMFGFPYPPLSLFLYLPSYALTGESRYAHALAYALCGLGMGFISRGRLATIAAALFLTAPAAFLIIESAWTEPFVLLMLVLVALSAARAPRWLPVALGLFFAIKQYNVIFLPLLFLLLPRPLDWRRSLRFLGVMVLTGAIVSLPLALWNWPAFWNSNVTIQIKQPFRHDAFSYLALIANTRPGNFDPPRWWSMIPFALLLPTWAILLWRLPRNMTGFVLGVAGTSIVFLFFNRQAFLNYHTFAAGALLLAVAVMEKDDDKLASSSPEAGVERER